VELASGKGVSTLIIAANRAVAIADFVQEPSDSVEKA
jgi:hypothetical protein